MNKHSALITQFAKMVALGYPIDKLVQSAIHENSFFVGKRTQFEPCPKPVWDEDIEYQVASTFVSGQPMFFCTPVSNEWLRDRGYPLSFYQSSIADLKITVDNSSVIEATNAMNELTLAADRAREAMDRLRM